MMETDKDFSDLSHEELLEIIHSEHITSEQLNLFASRAKHLTTIKKEEVEKLTRIMATIDAKIREMELRARK